MFCLYFTLGALFWCVLFSFRALFSPFEPLRGFLRLFIAQ
nr:MAG TPA: hypothetical protein [Caudoviricetes sp.]